MTRKEQIKEYLLTIGNGEMTGIPFDVGFECGVEWADSHTNWISVEDELPKEDGTYLFYDAESQGAFVSYFWADLTLNENISHWMRIKKPTENRKGEQNNG